MPSQPLTYLMIRTSPYSTASSAKSSLKRRPPLRCVLRSPSQNLVSKSMTSPSLGSPPNGIRKDSCSPSPRISCVPFSTNPPLPKTSLSMRTLALTSPETPRTLTRAPSGSTLKTPSLVSTCAALLTVHLCMENIVLSSLLL